MKKRFTEAQIVGFLREADAGIPVKDLCRKHGFSMGELLPLAQQVWRHERVRRQAPERARDRKQPSQEVARGRPPGKRGDP